MKNYKGFEIPETKDEVVGMMSSVGMPSFTIHDDNGTSLNLPITFEDVSSGNVTIDELYDKSVSIIDNYLESI